MIDALAFFVRHHSEVVAVAIAIWALAVAVVNATPTPRDNEFLDAWGKVVVKGYRVIEIIAGIWTRNAKS